MKILVTGSNGFLGKNLIAELQASKEHEIFKYDLNNTEEELNEYTKKCEFVFHLAGVNRPEKIEEFYDGNCKFTNIIIEKLESNNNLSPVLMTSSIQALLDNPYGKSKKSGEDSIIEYSKRCNIPILIYRLPNVFGKWCKPNYNSVIATFCHNIAHNLEIKISDKEKILSLVYIDDIIKEFTHCIKTYKARQDVFYSVKPIFEKKLGLIADLLFSFRDGRKNLYVPDSSDEFTKKLYSTYLSYLPLEEFNYSLKMNIDNRGSFTEIIKNISGGQVSVNILKPEITKGNHWHHSKIEKFLVVSGEGKIKFRNIINNDIVEYIVTGENLHLIDIPPGFTHNITNIGKTDLITIIWCNESFDIERPDTFYLEV